jgi:hypothetical protein
VLLVFLVRVSFSIVHRVICLAIRCLFGLSVVQSLSYVRFLNQHHFARSFTQNFNRPALPRNSINMPSLSVIVHTEINERMNRVHRNTYDIYLTRFSHLIYIRTIDYQC